MKTKESKLTDVPMVYKVSGYLFYNQDIIEITLKQKFNINGLMFFKLFVNGVWFDIVLDKMGPDTIIYTDQRWENEVSDEISNLLNHETEIEANAKWFVYSETESCDCYALGYYSKAPTKDQVTELVINKLLDEVLALGSVGDLNISDIISENEIDVNEELEFVLELFRENKDIFDTMVDTIIFKTNLIK